MVAPGVKMRGDARAPCSVAMSALGDDAAAEDEHVVEARGWRSSSTTRGNSVMWAPERTDRPTASASSCSDGLGDLLGRLEQARCR